MYIIHNSTTGEHLDGGCTRYQVQRALARYNIQLTSPLPRKGRKLLIVQPAYMVQAGKPSVVITVV